MLKPMSPGVSPAVQSLGLGGMLGQQVKDETDEERKKRMKQMQEQSLMGTIRLARHDRAVRRLRWTWLLIRGAARVRPEGDLAGAHAPRRARARPRPCCSRCWRTTTTTRCCRCCRSSSRASPRSPRRSCRARAACRRSRRRHRRRRLAPRQDHKQVVLYRNEIALRDDFRRLADRIKLRSGSRATVHRGAEMGRRRLPPRSDDGPAGPRCQTPRPLA
jgi:hypothetical protein